jgi:DNA-binding MarR family transcriptional regulator
MMMIVKEANTEILIKIRRIIRSINLESKRVFKEYGVSIPQVLCLSYLKSRANNMANHKDIASYLNLNSSTLTGIIQRLEKKGLIAKLPKGDDKRQSNIALTAKGDELLKHIPPLMHQQISKKLQTLSLDEIQRIHEALDKLIALLGVENIEAAPLITYEDDLMHGEE